MTGYGDSQRIESELAKIFKEAENCHEEIQASLARYACVLASGYLESSFREIVIACAQAQASPPIVRYVNSTLGWFRDPNIEKIFQLLGRLDQKYRVNLETQVLGELKDSVDSIAANRNNIAHGRSSGISLGQVRKYFADAQTVVAKARTIIGL